MTGPARKIDWLDRAKETYHFHSKNKREHGRWGIKDTAKLLGRSFGSVSQDLTMVSWWRSHPTQMEKFDYAQDALEFIKMKKSQLAAQDIEE